MTATQTATRATQGWLRRSGGPLDGASIGIVPITWNNGDLPDLAPPVPADFVLDEIARLGFEGTQTGVGYPAGEQLAAELAGRGLRLAEIYAALPCTQDGPTADALAVGRARLAELVAAKGEVLVAALDLSPAREPWAGRATSPGAPRLTDGGWHALAQVIETLAREAEAAGCRLAYHQHAGTFVERPEELDRLVAELDAVAAPAPSATGICLDVGHFTVGGGDPVAALRRYGERVVHVHLKDVDPEVLAGLQEGSIRGFLAALRARIYTELGGGVLDVPGVLEQLAARRYHGWIMLEQDTTWNPASESAAIGRRVLAYAMRHLEVGGER